MALRRQMKNVVRNFTDIEVKVREATSNDPWGPSSSFTSEIADATYNVQAFSEIMTLLWKRINDHGKNWRHVYKSLVVLDYIVKTGSERVAQQCRENIFALKTLKDFQFIDKDGKDQGINVREKSKQLVALLKDDERLKSERQRALKAKERFSQSQGGIGNTSFPKNKRFQGTTKYTESRGSVDDSNLPSQSWKEMDRPVDSHSTDGRIDSDMEKVRPSNEVEEEMQLQIALAMSREEAEQKEKLKDTDEQLFNMTLNQGQPQPQPSTLLNLSDPAPVAQASNAHIYDPWLQQPNLGVTQAPPVQPVADPWGVSTPSINLGAGIQISQPAADPWESQVAPTPADPWGESPPSTTSNDPWADTSSQNIVQIEDPFAPQVQTSVPLPDPFAPLLVGDGEVNLFDSIPQDVSGAKMPSFLANGAHLVDVDNILAPAPDSSTKVGNPFMTSNTNPFLQDKPKPKSINEMRYDRSNQFSGSGDTLLPTPLAPANKESANNPFL